MCPLTSPSGRPWEVAVQKNDRPRVCTVSQARAEKATNSEDSAARRPEGSSGQPTTPAHHSTSLRDRGHQEQVPRLLGRRAAETPSGDSRGTDPVSEGFSYGAELSQVPAVGARLPTEVCSGDQRAQLGLRENMAQGFTRPGQNLISQETFSQRAFV